jgi:hypothetical protein
MEKQTQSNPKTRSEAEIPTGELLGIHKPGTNQTQPVVSAVESTCGELVEPSKGSNLFHEEKLILPVWRFRGSEGGRRS